MRIAICCLLIMIFCTKSDAQQSQSWSSFYEVGFLWNPALTAKWNAWELSSTIRKDWTGFENSPESGNVSFQYPILNRRTTILSFGGYVDYDKVGPFSQRKVGGTVAYKVRPQFFGKRNDVLSIGGNLSLKNLRFDPTNSKAIDGINGDRNLTISEANSYAPSLSLGAYYMSVSDQYSFKSHYYFGVSGNNLIPTKFNITPAGDLSNAPSIAAHAGFRHFPRRSPYYIEPNVFVNYSFTKAMTVMANLRYERVNGYWFSAGLVSNGEVFGQIGLIFNDRSFLGKLVKDGLLRIGTKVVYQLGSLGQFAGMGYEAYVAYVFENE